MAHWQRIVNEEIRKAKKEFGGGWDHFSVEIRYAIICARIVGISTGQDESIDPARIVAGLKEMQAHAWEATKGNNR